MPENKQLPTASIPSKHRARSGRGDVRGSLIVTKLEGITSLDDIDVTSILNEVNLPNSEAISKMNSSRLKKEIKLRINNMEYDPRSLELLIRLLKSGPLAHDVTNDENRRPPSAPAPSEECVAIREETGADVTSSNILLISPSGNPSPRVAVATDPSARFRKSIEALKSARERFGVSMSVNGNIAKARTIQQQNLKNRKASREKLPMLKRSPSGESIDGERTPRISHMRPWLTLSGRRIQLKHQGHVERVLGHPEPQSKDIPKKKRQAKSAPPRSPGINLIPLQRFAWSDGNKFVIQKVSRTFRNARSPINLPDASPRFHAYNSTTNVPDTYHGFHGYQSPTSLPDALHGYHGFQSTTPNLELRNSEDFPTEKTLKTPEKAEKKKLLTDLVNKNKNSKPAPVATPAPVAASTSTNSEHEDASSRPSSSTMPRPVRSVIIKLPKSEVESTPASTVVTSSRTMTSQRRVNSFPIRPIVNLNLR